MTATYNETVGLRDACPDNVLVHFLDHEILQSFGVNRKNHKRVLRELRLAFRIGLLLARNGVILPASHRFESSYAARILEQHKVFADFSFINLASNTLDIAAFFEQKQQQYSGNTQRHPLYFEKTVVEIENEFIARWILKKNDSTRDIVAEWLRSIGSSDTWGAIYRFSNVTSVSTFERELALAPERLEGQAFVGDFVTPLLPFSKAPEVVLRFINILIQRAYINSFVQSFDAACLDDLPLFDTSILLPEDRARYSVSRAKRYLYKKGMLRFVEFCTPEELLRYKLTSWLRESELFCIFTRLNQQLNFLTTHGDLIYGGIMKAKLKQITAIENHLNECVEVLEACYEDTLGGALLRRSASKKMQEVNLLMAERESELLTLIADVSEADKMALSENLTIARNPESSGDEKSKARTVILTTVKKIGDKIIDMGGDIALRLMLRSAGLDAEQ